MFISCTPCFSSSRDAPVIYCTAPSYGAQTGACRSVVLDPDRCHRPLLESTSVGDIATCGPREPGHHRCLAAPSLDTSPLPLPVGAQVSCTSHVPRSTWILLIIHAHVRPQRQATRTVILKMHYFLTCFSWPNANNSAPTLPA